MLMFPFKATLEEINKDPENYVDSVFSCLESEFLVMPKGAGFVEYPAFELGYESLKAATSGFSMLDPVKIYPSRFLSQFLSLYFVPCLDLHLRNGGMLRPKKQAWQFPRDLFVLWTERSGWLRMWN